MSCVPPSRRGIGSAVRSAFISVGMAISLNLAVLIISLKIPYALVTQIASGYATTLPADKTLFMEALKTTYLWLAALNALAILPSLLRGKGSQKLETEKPTDLDVAL